MSNELHMWTHAQCDQCWIEQIGHALPHEVYAPVRLTEPLTETCCYCGRTTRSGIYRREKPLSGRIMYCPDHKKARQ